MAKCEYKYVPPPPPVHEYALTLNSAEAHALYSALTCYSGNSWLAGIRAALGQSLNSGS